MKNKIIEKGFNPICIGSGLIALDVLINGNPKIPLKFFAGGSCGNVLIILAFFDWSSYPIARFKENKASKKILIDLKNWKVNTPLITQTSDGSTPIIIQRIKKDRNGNSIHKFEFKNPETGKWLPSYKPVLGSEVEKLISLSPIPSVFYFDRVNRSSIELAKYFKGKGALIFFEPSSMKEKKQFEECLEVADIIKFSNERIKDYALQYPKQRVPLEIETMGKDGLRYRFSHQLISKEWKNLSGYQISYVVDSAGAGDWFSAGIILKIGSNGSNGFKECSEKTLLKVLKFGQALGTINCFFDGARGLMYSIDKIKLEGLIKKIQMSKTPMTIISKKEESNTNKKLNISTLY